MDPQTIATYNELAYRYDEQTKKFWEAFPTDFLDQFAAEAHGKVLNIGSGPGRDAELLRDRRLDVICLDASSVMVQLTRERGFSSVQGDLLELPFADATFDGVWAYTSLLHITKTQIDQALDEIKRVLKPASVIGLGMIEGNDEKYVEDKFVTKPRLFSYFTRSELEKLLKAHGFGVTYFEVFIPKRFTYLHFVAKKQ